MSYKPVDIETLNSGALIDLFQTEFHKILENVQDPNTKADAVREITLKVKVKPSKNRDMAETTVSSQTKLAPITPSESHVVLSYDGIGVEAFTTDPKQPPLPMEEENIVAGKFAQEGN